MAPSSAPDQPERVPLLHNQSPNPAPHYQAIRNGSSFDAQHLLITRGISPSRRSTDKTDPSDLTVKIQAICPNIHCPSCISHLETLVSTLTIHPTSQARIGNVDTSLIDRSVNIELIISPTTNRANVSPRDIFKLLFRLLRQLASILAEDGFPIDHLRSKLSSGKRAERTYKDALCFILDASDLYDNEEESPSQSAHSLPNNTHLKSGFQAFRHSSILGTFPASLGSTLRSAWSRTADKDSARLQQERWRKHIQICEACRDGVSGDTNEYSPLLEHADHAGDSSQSATSGVDVGGSNKAKKRVMATFSISGMTCASCAQSITRAVQADASIPIDSIDVNVVAASATVVTHPSSVPKVAEIIDDAGFEAVLVKTGPIPKPRNEHRAQDSDSLWTAKFSVQGMTCASCVQSITSALDSFAEESNPENAVKILKTSVNLMGKSADVAFATDPREAVGKSEVERRAKEVVSEIEDIGFDAELLNLQQNQRSREGNGNSCTSNSEMRSVRIKVEGMFCQNCVAKVRGYFEITQKDYPSDIEVNQDDFEEFTLSKPFLNFSYKSGADSHIRLRDVLEDVNQLDPAFAAQYSPPASLASRSAVLARKELRDLLLRLGIAALFAVPTLVISMVAPVLPPEHPLRRYLSRYVLGSATRGEVAMWIISTPVQFGVGSIFFKKAWRSLSSVWKKGRSWTDRLLRFGNMDVLVALGTLVAYTSSLAFLLLDATRRPQDQHKVIALSVRADEDDKTGIQNEMGMTYFEVSVFLVFFILLGRALESISKKKTGDAVADLGKMKPSSAYLVLDASNLAQSKTEVVDVDMLEIGDYVLVPYGSSPPLDGIFAGTSTGKQDVQGLLDESSLSGEARPVTKQLGDELFAGTINVSPNAIFARIGVLPGSCMIDEILDVVQESAGKKASIAQLADKITGIFVPVIVYISLLVFILWTILLYGGGLSEAWQAEHVPHYGETGAKLLWALQFGISCLLVACPCGIGLAAPTSQLAGIGLASKHGILVNGGGEAFRAASAAARGSAELVVVFDKTGTITKGEAVKVTSHCFASAYENSSSSDDLDQNTLLRCIDLVEQSSTHPYATAVRDFVAAKLTQGNTMDKAPARAPRLVDITEVPGKGVRATFDANKEQGSSFLLLIGNKRLMDDLEGAYIRMDESIKQAEQHWWTAANSVIYIGMQSCSKASKEEGVIVLALAIADVIRPEAWWVIQHLQQRFSAEVWMVSGDNEATAHGVATQVGIPVSQVVAGVLPVQKKEWVEKLQLPTRQRELEYPTQSTGASKRRWWWRGKDSTWTLQKRMVCFVGDGINDSPALSSASLAIALGSGSSIAHSSSDFILLRRHAPLLSIPLLLTLSKATYFKIWSNFGWAFVFNLCLIPIAAGALVGIGVQLGPALSGLAMAFSSTSVVLNSLTLRWWKPEWEISRQIDLSQKQEDGEE